MSDPWKNIVVNDCYACHYQLALLDLKQRLEAIESSVRKSDVAILRNRVSELESARVEMSSLTYTDVSRYVDTRLGLAISLPEVRDCEEQVWGLYKRRGVLSQEQYRWLRARCEARGRSLEGPFLSTNLPDRQLSGDR